MIRLLLGKIKFWPLVMLLFFNSAVKAQRKTIPVFTAGAEGYKSYRIPAIVQLANGQLLAFCEGRVNNAGDFGNIDIVMKRSKDQGKTWGPLELVADMDVLQAGNPAPVLDETDPAFPKGRLLLFYNTGNNHEGEVRKGRGLREVWYKSSVDGGLHWSEPVNITLQVHRPKQTAINSQYNFADDWRSYANTPGHAIQLTGKKYHGRIYVAANHSAGEPRADFTDYTAHGFYTDDHCKTFRLSINIPLPGSNESTAVELSRNRLMVNSRNQRGDTRARIVAISNNGGQSWDTVYSDKQLPDPVCEGSILRAGYAKGLPVIAFCNAADTASRDRLTLRISFDEGRSWKQQYMVDQSTGEPARDYSAYADIVVVKKNSIGILYEKNNYTTIVFTRVQWHP